MKIVRSIAVILVVFLTACNDVYFTSPQPSGIKNRVTEIPQFVEGTFLLIDSTDVSDSMELKIVSRTDKNWELYFQSNNGSYDIIPDVKLNLDKNILIFNQKEGLGSYRKLINKVEIKKIKENQYSVNMSHPDSVNRWQVLVFNLIENDFNGNLKVILPEFKPEEYLQDSLYYKSRLRSIDLSTEDYTRSLIIDATDSEFYSLLKEELLKTRILERR